MENALKYVRKMDEAEAHETNSEKNKPRHVSPKENIEVYHAIKASSRKPKCEENYDTYATRKINTT